MPVSNYLGNIAHTVKSAWEGMSITLSYMFRRPITVQYEGPERAHVGGALLQHSLPARYRGFLEVDMDTCTACLACERACPIDVIAIEVEKDPANPRQRVMTRFDIDIGKCMFCGLCVEPCPTGSIQHTREFEGSQRFLTNMVLRFVDPARPVAPYKPPKGATAYPRVVLGEVTRALIRKWDSPPPPFPPRAPRVEAPDGGGIERGKHLARKALGVDPRALAKILEQAFAGKNCSACTYPSCFEYAAAISAEKERRWNLCEPGGDASAQAVHVVMDSHRAGEVVVSESALAAEYQKP